MTVHVAGTADSLLVRVDTGPIERFADRAPQNVYFWMRDFLGSVFGKHRQDWLRNKGTKFGRGSNPRSIKVWPVNEGPANVPGNGVVYRVTPAEKRAGGPLQAAGMLNQLRAEAVTGSAILRVHEFGEDIRSGRLMAIPIKTRPGTPEKWRQKNPNKELIARPGSGGTVLLFERIRVRTGQRVRLLRTKTGRERTRQRRTIVDRLRLRFVLKRHIKMDPTLRLYETWDRLAGYRDTAFKRACDRIQTEVEAGKTS